MEFKDKIILITGAGSGIGKVTAISFAEAGGIVVVSDINEASGQVTVDEIIAAGGKSVFIKADVASYTDVENLITETVKQFGRLDIAVNNAGIGGKLGRFADTTVETWDKVMAVNSSGVFYCMKFEIQQMLKQGGGAIVNIASVAGLRGLPNNGAYVASKHAVVGMTKTAAMEYARKNIRINAICPVFTITALFNPAQMDEFSSGISEKLKSHIPIKRFAEPIEIANNILWLSSEKASFVTGLAMSIDGGLTA